MRAATIAFLAGILLFQQLPDLPDGRWAGLLWLSLPLSIALAPLKIPLWVLNGFLAALLQASAILASSLPPELEGRDIVIQGVVDSLPERHGFGQRFLFKVEQTAAGDEALPERLRLSWYDKRVQIDVGQRWQLKVRLKQPHGFMNPGGFDYEGWLFRHSIRATGYVRKGPENHFQGDVNGVAYAIDRVRGRLGKAMDEALPQGEFVGMIQALAIGQRQGITQAQWQVLLKTGTNHLMAISGLHVGLVAGLAFFLLRWGWSCSARLVQRWPAHKAAALAAISAALVYAALAGFSIPTQRALLMVVVFMLSILMQRYRRPFDGLMLALLLVLAYDPLALMDAGFWLSFAAVAFILFGLSGRIAMGGVWWKWGRVHLLLALALLPFTLLLFQKASLVSPVANLVAVPLVSLLVVPLVLLGALLLMVAPVAGTALLQLAQWLMQLLWPLLEWMSQWPAAQIYHAFATPWLIMPALLGVIWLLAPRGWPARWLGGVWLAAVFLWPQPRPALGEAWFTLLDVGQGLAAVVQTRNHALVFDAGPRFSDSFDTGDAVVVPFLLASGIGRVDTLLVSHGDNDHIGGAESLLQTLAVAEVLSSVPQQLAQYGAQPCHAGQYWHWDGIDFAMLHPAPELRLGENDSSCVLKVSSAAGSLLLSGDIERRAERLLLGSSAPDLDADVLVVPHHGSKTSSTAEFIAAVSPRWALIPAGYRNRFKLPRREVVERYQAQGIEVMQSGLSGAISLRLGESEISAPLGYRDEQRKYWSHIPKQGLVATEK